MTKPIALPPLERLNELLEIVPIDPSQFEIQSGLVWRISRGGQKAGSVAGTKKPSLITPGRFDWRVRVDGRKYLASRVIYFMANGEDPGELTVDHEDQNPMNNNSGNLRLANSDTQQINSPMYRNNTSGVTGVTWSKARGKWAARTRLQGKYTYLGYYTCKIEAARIVRDKWVEFGWDKLGRELPNLDKLECGCHRCAPHNFQVESK
jgi:hypothetical protein